jgi:hypothetical protein
VAGLHFSCGEWLGGDKTASPFFDVVKALRRFVPRKDRARWRESFLAPLNAPTASGRLELSPAMLEVLAGPLKCYRDELVTRLGLSGPGATIEELGAFPRVISDEEEVWLCVSDLLAGSEVSRRTGQPIVITFA